MAHSTNERTTNYQYQDVRDDTTPLLYTTTSITTPSPRIATVAIVDLELNARFTPLKPKLDAGDISTSKDSI